MFVVTISINFLVPSSPTTSSWVLKWWHVLVLGPLSNFLPVKIIIKFKYVLHVCRNRQHQLCRALITNNITLSAQIMTRVGAWASVKLFSTQDHQKVQICSTCLSSPSASTLLCPHHQQHRRECFNDDACWCLGLMCCHIAKHTWAAAAHIHLQIHTQICV